MGQSQVSMVNSIEHFIWMTQQTKFAQVKMILFSLVGMFLATLSDVFVFPLSTWVKNRPLNDVMVKNSQKREEEGRRGDLKLLQKFVIKYFILIAKQSIQIMLIPKKYSNVYEERS